MSLHDQITDILAAAVENRECAGVNVLVRRHGEEILYTQAGMADLEEGRLIQRDSIFRLYSQTKPVTAAAVMLLVERGLIDLMDGVDKFLPGFRNPKVVDSRGCITRANRAPWIMELLGMTAGLCYPDGDPAGQYAARVFEDAHKAIEAGGGIPTVEFMNRLGEQPLAFNPGTHWRYSTCADVLGAVVEVVSGKRFGDFLKEELFIPLNMVDTAFFVPAEKMDRFVTCYERVDGNLSPWLGMNLACGVYDRDPAFESGGAGLVSTLEDYSHFADMMMNKGVWNGQRILSPRSVEFLTTPQLNDVVRRDMWDSLSGFSYGKLCRVCVEPEQYAGYAMKGEYGWDGWLGSYYANFPCEGMTILSMQNTTNAGTSTVVRKVRNAVIAALSRGDI
ncbi:MAG: beta-lactamase family protein [Clostridia bacterium]|nr:beta-lactamase family protein [Clostridia bacterium]